MYIHRDIKRENIFVHRSGHIKLAEFVLVRRMPRGESLNNPCGTHYSPEMKQAPISYGLPADVWAVGIVMYEPGKLYLLKALLAEDPEERPKIRHVKRMEFFKRVDWNMVTEQAPLRIPVLDDDNDLRHSPQDEKAKDPVDDQTDYIQVWNNLFIPQDTKVTTPL
ncbi:hypothetical protein L5515_019019 [Caenorhabditis briggsae]|nr:hypothetical protein L5515_019019 [Caenorhabditis briggsae]